ncbi:MAG TPA: toll/interleukin-1 receptor domain-containing protein [Candidatus Brocadiaceae bacterium]|nr:toll/interleukin-1 receptor domain-containing protein [Candidatus Brocadiaceae bacterium]
MWDVFISHASEDKEAVRPLVDALIQAGLSVWFDEQTLKLGDVLRRKIDEGLANCTFGVVILSEAFLNKEWPQRELDGLFSREDEGRKIILPVWHKVSFEKIRSKSPTLASKLGISTAAGTEVVVKAILDAVGIEKKPEARVKVLRFADEIHSDMVSVKFAVSAFKKGETKFSIL